MDCKQLHHASYDFLGELFPALPLPRVPAKPVLDRIGDPKTRGLVTERIRQFDTDGCKYFLFGPTPMRLRIDQKPIKVKNTDTVHLSAVFGLANASRLVAQKAPRAPVAIGIDI